MNIRHISVLTPLAVLILATTSCDKPPDYVEGPETIYVVDSSGSDTTILGEQATAYSVNYGWPGTTSYLIFEDIGAAWSTDHRVAQLTIPGGLRAGDRVITMLQLGLQKPDASSTENMHLEAGAILGTSDQQTPDNANGVFGSGITLDVWDEDELTRQFTRYGELEVGSNMPSAVIQACAKPWSAECAGDTCNIVSCSFTVIVVPG
jgi:hypothetical protein